MNKILLAAFGALALTGCSKEKSAEEKRVSCKSSIQLVQENAVCDVVLAIADDYNKTGSPLSCAGAGWSKMGLPFDIRRMIEIYKNDKDIWLKDCDKEALENNLQLSVGDMRFIFEERICNKKAKEDFLECRSGLVLGEN
jgi:hypothetical protein